MCVVKNEWWVKALEGGGVVVFDCSALLVTLSRHILMGTSTTQMTFKGNC